MFLIHRFAQRALTFASLLELTLASWLPAIEPRHGLFDRLQIRQIEASTTDSVQVPSMTLSTTAPVTTYTLVTPSPFASPVAIASQSQVVTTYVPILTLCPTSIGGGANAASSLPPYANTTALPYRNLTSTTYKGCITEFCATETTVCDTILNGIATRIHVTACHQQITFSSLLGYELSTIDPIDTTETGPAPSLETITTYFQADWQALTDGLTPSDVTERICSAVATNARQCVDIQEVWSTITVTSVRYSRSHVCVSQLARRGNQV